MNTTQTLFARLLPTLLDGKISAVHMGLYWTAVLAEKEILKKPSPALRALFWVSAPA